VSFVFGCQRSGTKLLMRVVDRSPFVRVFHENHASAFEDFQLRSDATLRALIRLSPAPRQVFKPICDSQRADELLAAFPDARAIWIYRNPDDVANSAVEKWGAHQLEVVAAVAEGELGRWGWRTARLSAEAIQAVRDAYRPDLSSHEGALLFWYLRNSFFFSLGLDHDPRMALVNYERVVADPAGRLPPLFAHIGLPHDPSFSAEVSDRSVGRCPPPEASAAVRALVDGMIARLDAVPPLDVRPPGSVLLLINTLGTGGAERYVVTVANWLAEHGVRVVVGSSGGELVPEFDPRVTHVDLPLRRVRGALPKVAALVRQLIATHEPAVIVGNSLAVTWIARAAQVQRRVPIVNVAHGWPEDRYATVGRLMRVADHVVAVSPDVKKKLVDGGLSSSRCSVIHNGVDCRGLAARPDPLRSALRAELGAGPDDVLVAVIGRTERQKAQHHVIALSARLAESHPGLRFVIAGDGSLEDELRQRVVDEGQQSRVLVTGLRMDVPDILGVADIYLNCSDWEGMPLTTIEAMATGLPVVATHTEGADQLLTEACALVVPVGDVGAMAEAVSRLADDPELRARMGAVGHTRALAHFSHDRMVGELATVLAQVTW